MSAEEAVEIVQRIKRNVAALPAEEKARYEAMDQARANYELAAGQHADIVCFLHSAHLRGEGPPEACVGLNAIFDTIAYDQLALEVVGVRPRTWQETLEHYGIFNEAALDERKAKLKLGGSN